MFTASHLSSAFQPQFTQNMGQNSVELNVHDGIWVMFDIDNQELGRLVYFGM